MNLNKPVTVPLWERILAWGMVATGLAQLACRVTEWAASRKVTA